jgi:hypothetical protein
MTRITIYLSILPLNINGLDFSIKTHQLANWIKRKIQQSASYRRPTSLTERSTVESERLEEELPIQWHQ